MGKVVPSKAGLNTFLLLNCSNFKLKLCEGLSVTKIIKEIKFEGAWGKLEGRTCFRRDSFTKYLRLTLVFM